MMRVRIITHYDLDGVCSGIIAKRFFDERNMEATVSSASYGDVDQVLTGIRMSQKEQGQEYTAVITDLCVAATQLLEFLKDPLCKHLVYVDHHPRRDAVGLTVEDLKARYHKKFKVRLIGEGERNKAACLLAHELFDPNDAVSKKLAFYGDAYDCWRLDSQSFMRGYGLNALFWEYGFDKFFERFYGGPTLNDEEKALLEARVDKMDAYFKEVDEQYKLEAELDDGRRVLFVYHPECKYTNEMTLRYKDFDYYLAIKAKKHGEIVLSGRSRNGSKIGKVAAAMNNGTTIRAGGHGEAAGFNLSSDSVDMGEFLEEFVSICESTPKE